MAVMKKTNGIRSVLLTVVMAFAMVITLLPATAVTAKAAYPDQTFTLKVPEKFYSSEADEEDDFTGSEIINYNVTSTDTRPGYVDIRRNRGDFNAGKRQGYMVITTVSLKVKSKSSVFRLTEINGSEENFRIDQSVAFSDDIAAISDYASTNSDTFENNNSHSFGENYLSFKPVKEGMYTCSNTVGKIPIGSIYIAKPGKYSIVLEDITSDSHETVTLNIDTNYPDTLDSNGDPVYSFNSSIVPVTADFSRAGTELGSKTDNSSSDAKYVNGIYYLNYNNGNNTFLLKFPIYRNVYDLKDWTGMNFSISKISLNSNNSGVVFSDNTFLITNKMSSYTFGTHEVDLESDSRLWNDADGMHSENLNGVLFRITQPINGVVKLPVVFYDYYDEHNIGEDATLSVSTDKAPGTSSISDDNDYSDSDDNSYDDDNSDDDKDYPDNDFRISLDEDSSVNYTVKPREGYTGKWGALLYKGDETSDPDPSLFYDDETGEKSERVVLKAGDYTLSFIGDDSDADFDFTYDISPEDLGSPSVKSVSTKKISDNKVKYNSVTIRGDAYDTDGYRVKIAKKKNMSGSVLNKVNKVSSSGKVTLNTTKQITGKYAYVTVTPYVEDYYGRKIWGDESPVRKISLPKISTSAKSLLNEIKGTYTDEYNDELSIDSTGFSFMLSTGSVTDYARKILSRKGNTINLSGGGMKYKLVVSSKTIKLYRGKEKLATVKRSSRL